MATRSKTRSLGIALAALVAAGGLVFASNAHAGESTQQPSQEKSAQQADDVQAQARIITVRVKNLGGFSGNVQVYNGQYPNGGPAQGSRLGGATSFPINTTKTVSVLYPDDGLGLTVFLGAVFGSEKWITYKPDVASDICFEMTGTSIVNFDAYEVGC